jgi:hypothetical protein
VDDEIGLGISDEGSEESETRKARRLVPMRVGEATVYVELAGEPPAVEGDDEIYGAAPTEPGDIFGKAGKALKEVVRVVGEQVAALGEKARPEQVSVEFALSFEAGGRAQLIPVLFTGETKAVSGLKVTAVWEIPTAAPVPTTFAGWMMRAISRAPARITPFRSSREPGASTPRRSFTSDTASSRAGA